MLGPVSKPTAAPASSPKPPARPAMRTSAPQPFNIQTVDDSVNVYRGASAAWSWAGPVGLGLYAALYPSELGDGTMDNYVPDEEGYSSTEPARNSTYSGARASASLFPSTGVSPAIEHIDVRRNGRAFEAYLNRAVDPWHPLVIPTRYVRGKLVLPSDAGYSPMYMPEGEEAYSAVSMPPVPIREGLPEIRPPVGLSQWVDFSVSDSVDGPVVRGRTANRPEPVLSRPRYRDSKYGKSLVGLINRAITVTWGTVSEVGDAVDALVHNTYGVVNGRVVPAMTIERGSTLSVVRGMLEGDYRTDTVGFTIDYAIQQASDMAYALQSDARQRFERNLGFNKPYSQEAITNAVARNIGERHYDVSTQWVYSASQWLRSQDRRRASRVSSLF